MSRRGFESWLGRVACLGALWATGCATYAERTELARSALRRGDLAGGEAQFNGLLRVRKSEQPVAIKTLLGHIEPRRETIICEMHWFVKF